MITAYAFCGTMDLEHDTRNSCRHLPVAQQGQPHDGAPRRIREAMCIQWLSDEQHVTEMSSSAGTLLLLAGNFPTNETLLPLQERLTRVFLDRAYERFSIQGDVAGAFLSPHRAIFFKSHTSNQTLFYRRAGTSVSWSTNPADLLTSADTFNHEALVACCQAHDAWIYRGLSWVPAGCLVELSLTGAATYRIPTEAAFFSPPSPQPMQMWARLVYERLLAVTAPLAQSGQTVGVLLSGGIDSAALAASLVKNGGKVVAYHLRLSPAAADEYVYASAVCFILGIPLRCISATERQHFCFDQWRPVHPYGHPGFPWFAQVAEQMELDGVHLLVTGRYGDAAFGPLEHYGLADILTAPVAWREKQRFALHTLTTNWTLPEIARSSIPHPRFSLITTSTFTKSEQQDQPVRRADFLCPPPPTNNLLLYSDFPGERTLDFSPQDLAVEQLWRHAAIQVFHPYKDPFIQTLAAAIPSPYRMFAYRGQKITKPVLRLAFAHCLPSEVIRRNRGTWMSVPIQQYCLTHREWLALWLGHKQSRLVQQGIVDPQKLQAVLQNPRVTRANAYTLVATAMVEAFLRAVSLPEERG